MKACEKHAEELVAAMSLVKANPMVVVVPVDECWACKKEKAVPYDSEEKKP